MGMICCSLWSPAAGVRDDSTGGNGNDQPATPAGLDRAKSLSKTRSISCASRGAAGYGNARFTSATQAWLRSLMRLIEFRHQHFRGHCLPRIVLVVLALRQNDRLLAHFFV